MRHESSGEAQVGHRIVLGKLLLQRLQEHRHLVSRERVWLLLGVRGMRRRVSKSFMPSDAANQLFAVFGE